MVGRKSETTEFTDEELVQHVRDEFSTYGFLLESMLDTSGFSVLEATYVDDFYATYVCEWDGEVDSKQ